MSIMPGSGPPLKVRQEIYGRAVEFGVVGVGGGAAPATSALADYERSVGKIARRRAGRYAAAHGLSGVLPWVIFYVAFFVMVFNDPGDWWFTPFLGLAAISLIAAVVWAFEMRAGEWPFRRKGRPHPMIEIAAECIRFGEALLDRPPTR